MSEYNPKYGIAIDQYGQKYQFGENCLEDLCDQIEGPASAVFIDTKGAEDPDGTYSVMKQTGYVIGEEGNEQWLDVYVPFEVRNDET